MATQILYNGKVPTIGTDTYRFAVQGHTNWTTSLIQTVMLQPPYSGTIKHLRVRLSAAPGSGATRTFEVFNGNGGNTGISVTFGSGDSGVKEDLVNAFSINKFSRLNIKETHTGNPNLTSLQHSLMMEGDVSGETALMGRTGTRLGNLTKYISFAGHDRSGGETTEAHAEIVIPTPGTLTDFTVELEVQPGAITKSRIFTVRKNGADTALSFTLTNLEFMKTDISTVTVAKGDLISVKASTANNPLSSNASVALVFIPDTVGEFIIPTARGTAFSTSSIRYYSVTAHERFVSSTVASAEQLSGDAFELRNIAVNLDTAPGSGNKYGFWFLEGGIAQGLQLFIEDTATAGDRDINTDVAAGILAATRVLPRFGPAASRGTICYTGFIAEPADAAEVSAMMMGANF